MSLINEKQKNALALFPTTKDTLPWLSVEVGTTKVNPIKTFQS